MQIYNVNLFEAISTNDSQFFIACVSVHLGCLAFIAPKLLEITNSIENISNVLLEKFNSSGKFFWFKFSLFEIYVSMVTCFLLIAIFSLLFDFSILLNLFFVFESALLSCIILCKMNTFHNKTLSLVKKYKYKTPEKENNKYPKSFSFPQKPKEKTKNIKWNNKILNLWEEVASFRIRQNNTISQILDVVDKGIIEFWNEYSKDIENKKIKFPSVLPFIGIINEISHIHFPLQKIVYLNQTACKAKDDELSYYLINRLIFLFSKTNNKRLEEMIESKFAQAIKYKIKYQYINSFDVNNISCFIDHKFKKLENDYQDEKDLPNMLREFDFMVEFTESMILNYKSILLGEDWQKMISNSILNHDDLSIIIKYMNIQIFKKFLINPNC